jgi:FAD/FMN-containing dehydrogenase
MTYAKNLFRAAAADDPGLAELADRVTGAVFVPGDPGYAEETALFNLHLTLIPDVVVVAAEAADVQAAVRFATQRKMPIAVKSAGHQVVLPAEGGVLINTGLMKGLTVDTKRRVARVEAGMRWDQVLEATATCGLSPMVGSAPHVGVVGYTLGGGLSPVFGRSQGYAADHVLSMEVVTADGELRVVTATSEPDLYWAMRGCKGNFGVVTAIEFDLFPVTHVFGGGVYFAGEHAADVLHAWRTWVVTLPEEATSSVAVQRLPDVPELPEPLRGAFVVHLRFTHLGGTLEGERLLEPMRRIAPVVLDTVAEMPISETGTIHSDPIGPLPYWERHTSLKDLPAAAIDAFIEVVGPDSGCELAHVEMRHLGGAQEREPVVPNAVPTRDVPFFVFAFGVGPAERESLLVSQLVGLVTAMEPWSSPHLVPNFMAPQEGSTPDAMRRIYGTEKYERLTDIKAAYDPDNYFRINHNVRAV